MDTGAVGDPNTGLRHVCSGAPLAKRQREDPTPHERGRDHLTPRERFMQELTKCASDDDGEPPHDSSRRSGGHEARPSLTVRLGNAMPFAVQDPQAGNSFFSETEVADDGADRVASRESARMVPPLAVGSSLLMDMHRRLISSKNNKTCMASSNTDGSAMATVDAYAPLSSGGFLDADAANADFSSVRVGDIMVALRLPGAPRGLPAPSIPLNAHAASDANLRASATVASSSPTGASPTAATPSAAPSAAVAAVASQQHLSRFRAESSMTDDERRYGKRPPADMLTQLFIVTRLDRATQTLEGGFLDGTRAKLRLGDCRPAGFVERECFQQWRDDPASRPVHRISTAEEGAHGNEAATAGSAFTTSLGDCSGTAAADATAVSPKTVAAVSGSATPWWVLPNLLVRVVAPGAGTWLGAKCVVVGVRRAEATVRLVRADAWERQRLGTTQARSSNSYALSKASAAAAAASDTVEVVGLGGLETVLPRKNEAGMVVLGEHKGDMAIVLSRLRGPDGDLVSVSAQCTRTSEVLHLKPQELCAVARR